MASEFGLGMGVLYESQSCTCKNVYSIAAVIGVCFAGQFAGMDEGNEA